MSGVWWTSDDGLAGVSCCDDDCISLCDVNNARNGLLSLQCCHVSQEFVYHQLSSSCVKQLYMFWSAGAVACFWLFYMESVHVVVTCMTTAEERLYPIPFLYSSIIHIQLKEHILGHAHVQSDKGHMLSKLLYTYILCSLVRAIICVLRLTNSRSHCSIRI